MTPAYIEAVRKRLAERIARSAGQHARAVRKAFAQARKRLEAAK